MALTLNELLNQKQSDLIWEVFVGDVNSWFARFLEDEKVPPRKGLTTNILAIVIIITCVCVCDKCDKLNTVSLWAG